VLCNLLGREMESGELPDDDEMIGALVEKVCYRNAQQYFGLTL
jgi:glucuronate isomerase